MYIIKSLVIMRNNKFTLFQTDIMTDEELDVYWAEIAQVKAHFIMVLPLFQIAQSIIL